MQRGTGSRSWPELLLRAGRARSFSTFKLVLCPTCKSLAQLLTYYYCCSSHSDCYYYQCYYWYYYRRYYYNYRHYCCYSYYRARALLALMGRELSRPEGLCHFFLSSLRRFSHYPHCTSLFTISSHVTLCPGWCSRYLRDAHVSV